jgi:uncharacterized membrane protein
MKKLSQRQYDFLEETLRDQVAATTIDEATKEAILTQVEVKDTLNFIRVLVTLGGVLIGLGFLTFIATNWDLFNRWVKLLIILGSLDISLGASYWTMKKNRLTSLGLMYLSALIYGAGIFLVEQIFFINLSLSTGFFVWAVGVFLLSSIHKDVLLFVFAHVLSALFIFNSFNDVVYLQVVAILTGLFFTNRFFGYPRLLTFGLLALAEISLLYVFAYARSEAFYAFVTFFVLGNAMYHLAPRVKVAHLSPDMVSLAGLLTLSIAGFGLTFQAVYTDVNIRLAFISWVFAIGFIGYLLYLASKRLLIPILAIAAVITRYYFDTFYDSIDRSLFFVLGGLMLLAFGYYIETVRRKGAQDASLGT